MKPDIVQIADSMDVELIKPAQVCPHCGSPDVKLDNPEDPGYQICFSETCMKRQSDKQ